MEQPRRADVVYYDAEKNGMFQHALINEILVPAHFQALCLDANEGRKRPYTEHIKEVMYPDGRAEYGFFAEMQAEQVSVTSTIFHSFDDATPAAVELIRSEIVASITDPKSLEQLLAAMDRPHDFMTIETFVSRHFYLQLDTSAIEVSTRLGYSVDGYEVVSPEHDAPQETALDLARKTVFEASEIVELVRALMSLELIDQANVKRFLGHTF